MQGKSNVMVRSQAAKVRFLIARSTPSGIPNPASGSSPRPLSVAEPRRITRNNTDAGNRVEYLLLPRLTLCLRLCRRPVQFRPMETGRPSFAPVRQSQMSA
jgi:hypothetical protein